MVTRLAENRVTAHYDEQASKYMQRAAENAKQADAAQTPKLREKYWGVAQEYFKKAIEALESSKTAAAREDK